MLKPKKLQVLGAVLTALILFGCFNTSDNGTEIPNELTGMIVTQDGKPAADAKVTLYPVGYVPGDTTSTQAAKFTTTTDANGRYAVAKISVGQYNILGSKDSLLSYSDSVSINDSAGALPTDTLNAPGSLHGKVQLQPQDDPRTATVQVLGTDDYANVDSAGNFILPALAKGEYQLRAVTILPDYVPLFKAVTVQAGSDDTLPEPLILIYTGIPVVTGITASLDTAAGIARVTWNPVHYSGFLSYLIYRDIAGALTFSQTPINTSRVTDTFYLDTLYRSAADTVSQAWEYRIRVQDVNGNLGSTFSLAVLNAVPPRTVQTAIQMRVLGNHHDSASIKDTVRIVADYNNPTYANQHLAWFIDGSSDTVRGRSLNAKSGSDTLVWVAPDTAVTRSFSIRFVDAAGRQWADSLTLSVVLDPPVANAGNDTTVSYGTSYTLHGTGTDVYGHVVKWAWDIGGKGSFVSTSSGDTTITLPDSADTNYLCILRVTDDDGVSGVDTVVLNITPSRVVGQLLTWQQFFHTFSWQGKLISFGWSDNPNTIEAFDTLTGQSTILTTIPPYVDAQSSTILNGVLYFFGGDSGITFINYQEAWEDSTVATYDLSSGSWGHAAPIPQVRFVYDETFAVGVGNKIFLMVPAPNSLYAQADSLQLWEYDPANGTVSSKTSMPDNKTIPVLPILCENQGKLYALGGSTWNGFEENFFEEYDTLFDTWKILPNLPYWSVDGAAWVNGKLYAVGGYLNQYGSAYSEAEVNAIEEYDPIQNSWRNASPPLIIRSGVNVTSLGSNLYLLGGQRFLNSNYVEFKSIEEYKP